MTMKQDLEQQLKQLGQELTPSASLKSDVMLWISGTQRPSIKSLSIWRRIMRSPVTKIGALVASIAVCLLIYTFIGSGASVIWADVIKNLENIQTFKYRERNITVSEQERQGITFQSTSDYQVIYRVSKQWGRRRDTYHNGELGLTGVMDFDQAKDITLFYGIKRYKVRTLSTVEPFEQDDPHREVIHCLNQAPELYDLGEETIEGIVCEGVEIRDPNIFTWSPDIPEEFAMRIWVNATTEFPVMIENEFRMPGRPEWTTRIMDQFEWNVDLDPNLFELDIPADYTLMDDISPLSKPVSDPCHVSNQTTTTDEQITTLVNDLVFLGLEPKEPESNLVLTGMKEIWKTQDRITTTWLTYEEAKDVLAQDLNDKLAGYNLSMDQFKATAIALRERFWAEGGCLSETSYPYIYAARLMWEELHRQMPDDLVVTDELIETLQSVEFTIWFDPDTDEKYVNIPLLERLVALRSEQFEQIQEELDAGRTLAWTDFLCANDLALLLSRVKDYDRALQINQWLIDNAEEGQWIAYLQPLKNMQEAFIEQHGYNYNVLSATQCDYPEEFRYGRRLPSFKGPRDRGGTPLHLLQNNPQWNSSR